MAPLEPTPEFLTLAGEFGIEFDTAAGELAKLGTHLALVLAGNEQMNLTAITEPGAAWVRHVFDSLTLVSALSELPEGARVIDVGSGAGFPGVSLAIAMPHLKFTLLEATGKKADFLKRVCEKVGIDANVVCGRAETLGHDRGEKVSRGAVTVREGGHREVYDAVVARAVGPLATVAELTVPFARTGGAVYLIKGGKAEEELAAADKALKLLKVVHAGMVETPTGRIVVLAKQSATPRDFPRADGEPKRVPLGLVDEPQRRKDAETE